MNGNRRQIVLARGGDGDIELVEPAQRRSIHGMEGVRFYTKLKTVTSRWPSGIREGAAFHFSRGSDV